MLAEALSICIRWLNIYFEFLDDVAIGSHADKSLRIGESPRELIEGSGVQWHTCNNPLIGNSRDAPNAHR